MSVSVGPEGCLRHRCSSRSLRISPLHLEFHLPLPHSSHVVSSEIPKLSPGLNLGIALETTWLECGRGRWNSRCSGEMRRDLEEHRWRRQPSGPTLTLMHESVGSKQD